MGWILLMMYLMGETMEHWTEVLRSKRPFIDPEGFINRQKYKRDKQGKLCPELSTWHFFEKHIERAKNDTLGLRLAEYHQEQPMADAEYWRTVRSDESYKTSGERRRTF